MTTNPVTRDLDQSGLYFQRVRVYLGPTLGWVEQQIQPLRYINGAGPITLGNGDSRVLVNYAGAITINLPSVAAWLQQNYNTYRNEFDNSLWIKDIGGNAAANNITVTPDGTDTIDLAAASFVINGNYQLLRFYPLNFAGVLGWYTG